MQKNKNINNIKPTWDESDSLSFKSCNHAFGGPKKCRQRTKKELNKKPRRAWRILLHQILSSFVDSGNKK